jgi:dolichol-phosphate mannosyltransferase
MSLLKVSIIIPTYNEAENIAHLVEKIRGLSGNFRIIIVDDGSPDGTADIAEKLGQSDRNILVYRRPGKMGIGSAIHDGMKLALSFPECEHIVTMDADLSHDPQDIPRLLAATTDADLVQGSRYIKGGEIIGWSFHRKLVSRVANLIYKWLFGLPNEVTSFFRVYSRDCAELVASSECPDQYDFSIASALLVKDGGFKAKEVPIRFVNRRQGTSKLRGSDIISSFCFMVKSFWHRRLRTLDWKRFLKFCAVGAFGVLVNEGLLWLLTDGFGLFYLYSAMVSIEISIISNFVLNNLWTFRDRRLTSGNIFIRLAKYNLTCLVGVGLNLAVLWLMTEVLGVNYLISNLFGIAVAVVWNYSASMKWIWIRRAKDIEGARAVHR